MDGRIIVVGNSAELIGAGVGAAIDTHEIVIRCNAYRIDGYEWAVGSRVTHWIIGLWSGQLDAIRRQGVPAQLREMDVWVTGPQGRDPGKQTIWPEFCACVSDANALSRITYESLGPDIMATLFRFGAARGTRVWPTTGLVGICEAHRQWPDEVITMAGFWDGTDDTACEYFAPKRDVVNVPGTPHRYDAERRVIEHARAEGWLRRL